MATDFNIISMLALDADLDDICALKGFVRVLNILDIPFVDAYTMITRIRHKDGLCPAYRHIELKNNLV